MQLPRRKRLRIRRGDTKRIPLRWWTDTSQTSAIDVSGRTYSSKVKSQDGVTTILTATADMTLAAEGLVYIVFSDTDTAGATPGEYAFDIQEVNEDDDTTTLIAGPCTIESDVT